MNLFADESVDRAIVERLRADGHDIVSVTEQSPGLTDDEVLQQANDRGALLLTADKDFGELVYRLGRVYVGVMLLRLEGLPSPVKAETTAQAFQDHASELAGAFSVVSPGHVRIRRNPS